jgi:hypothetical protein
MEVVWGAVLSFLFILATLSGYGAGTPQLEKPKDQSEQSDKKDEDKKDEKSEDSSSKDKKGKSDQKDNGSSGKSSRKKAEYCLKDCPDAWRIRP